MRHDNYGHHHWKADDMATFLLDTTGIKIEKVCGTATRIQMPEHTLAALQ